MNLEEKRNILIREIHGKQDENGYWNVLKPGDKYYPDYQHYCPKYKSTLWTLILLADLKCRTYNHEKPFNLIARSFYDNENGIYTIGRSHFPIPCLNGNMLYLHSYFGFEDDISVNGIVSFFNEYQRFDDGDYKTPADPPYFGNRSCYGPHTCYWGVIKILKGLSFLSAESRTANAKRLLSKCIDYVLLHEVCFSSHDKSKFLHPSICKLGFPHMYNSDFLEILWLLKREGVRDKRLNKAVKLLKNKQVEGGWRMERSMGRLAVPFGNRKYGDLFITERAMEVLDFYG